MSAEIRRSGDVRLIAKPAALHRAREKWMALLVAGMTEGWEIRKQLVAEFERGWFTAAGYQLVDEGGGRGRGAADPGTRLLFLPATRATRREFKVLPLRSSQIRGHGGAMKISDIVGGIIEGIVAGVAIVILLRLW